MYSGTVTFVLFALFSAIVLVASNPIPGFKKPNKRAAATLKFEGCFSDSENSILPSAQKYESSNNINHDCIDKCAEGGYAISSTKGTSCYCTNDLPLPRLRKASDPEASGTDGPCSTTCPGASIAGTNTPCVGEECCGGPNAYSVFLSGEIDVLKQLLRRITASQTLGYDDAHIKKECEEKMKAQTILIGYFMYFCQAFSAYAVSACGTTITGNQITSIQNCTLTTTLKTKHEYYTCEDLASLPDKHVELEVVSLERLIKSEDPINEELATNYDIVSDNSHGTTDLTVSKSYQVSTSFSESWSTRHGFDFKITLGVETEVGAIFAKATTKFELTTGYSFTSTYSKTEGTAISETFSVQTVAAPGTKVITRFFKSQAPVQVNWRANILANGYVHVKDGGQYPEVEGDKTLVSLISDAQRRFFAFGTYDFGDRKMMIARSQTYDRYGNLISAEDDTKSVD